MEKFAALEYNNDEKIIRETIETPKIIREIRSKDSRSENFMISVIFFRMHFV